MVQILFLNLPLKKRNKINKNEIQYIKPGKPKTGLKSRREKNIFMAIWTSNNLACVNIWSILYVMKQHDEVFDSAGSIKMQELLFFNPVLSESELKFEAEGIADFLDKAFVNTCGSEYEKNIDRNKAVQDMVAVLIQKNMSMADLAKKVDDDYNF